MSLSFPSTHHLKFKYEKYYDRTNYYYFYTKKKILLGKSIKVDVEIDGESKTYQIELVRNNERQVQNQDGRFYEYKEEIDFNDYIIVKRTFDGYLHNIVYLLDLNNR